jgi:hypothetical protein
MKIFNYSLIFWSLVILVAFLISLKLAYWKGKFGERLVYRNLKKLDSKKYKVLSNLLLPSDGNTPTTQIDHIVVSNFGIFCIETKAYKGWIFGNINDQKWTQVIFNHKERFYNPFRQNYAHIKALESALGTDKIKVQIVPIVVFPLAARLEIIGTDNCVDAREGLRIIESFIHEIYTDEERDNFVNTLKNLNIKNKEIEKDHNYFVKKITSNTHR